METPEDTAVRLQKVMAASGVGSRRYCEELIAEGRVSVDGVVVDRQGVRVDPEVAVIRVDGERVVTAADRRYVVMNKPSGVVTSMSDERGRIDVGDMMRHPGMFHVGRLDVETEGVLLMMNDGELAHRLMHPSYGVAKTYLAHVDGRMLAADRRALLAGVPLDDGPAKADKVKILDHSATRSSVELVVHEGRNRLVRRMFEAVGHPVIHLARTKYGPIPLGDLRSGRSRPLNSQEIASLYQSVDL